MINKSTFELLLKSARTVLLVLSILAPTGMIFGDAPDTATNTVVAQPPTTEAKTSSPTEEPPAADTTDSSAAQPPTSGSDVYIDGKTPQERAAALLAYCATVKPKHEFFAKEAMFYYVARILTKTDTDYAISQWQKTAAQTLDKAVKGMSEQTKTQEPGSMEPFDKHQLVWAWIVCHDKIALPPDILENTKKYVALWHHKVWKGYGALNYRLMMDGSGFLAAENWPDLVDADGLTADQIKQATKERLMGYFHDITVNNHHEYGSPIYGGIDMVVMKMLAEVPQDPEVRHAASLALDAMFLQVAAAWNHGYLITPCGRDKYWEPGEGTPDHMETMAADAWVFWGADRPIDAAKLGGNYSGWFGVPGYTPPPLLEKIAHDRSTPITNRESFVDKNQQVRITLYQTPTYGVASQWEAEDSPTDAFCKETKRQMFKWVSDKPASAFIPLQENLKRPYVKSDTNVNAFGYGENPYTQVLQSEGTLIGVSKVDDKYPYWKIYAPFTTQGAIVKRFEKDGWVFCHGGSVLFAFRTVKPYTWGTPEHDCDILWSDDRTNGWVLETSPVAPYAGGGVDAELDRFAAAVTSKVKVDSSGLTGDTPNLKVTNLAGKQLDLTFRPLGTRYTDQHKVDGVVIDYQSFPLVETPQLTQQVGDEKQTLTSTP